MPSSPEAAAAAAAGGGKRRREMKRSRSGPKSAMVMGRKWPGKMWVVIRRWMRAYAPSLAVRMRAKEVMVGCLAEVRR